MLRLFLVTCVIASSFLYSDTVLARTNRKLKGDQGFFTPKSPLTQETVNTNGPKIIELSHLNFSSIENDGLAWDEIAKWQPFTNAIEFGRFFLYLKETFHINKAVETGTYEGSTTKCLSVLFDNVDSIEIQKDFYEIAVGNLRSFPNVRVHFGTSPEILSQILPLDESRTIFYLDAHWYSDWPLLGELKTISKTHYDNCIIVIDDFKVPERKDIPYDRYGIHECSYEYVKSSLSQIFSSYVSYYVLPKDPGSRAKFLAFPKSWIEGNEDWLSLLVSAK